MTRGETPHSQSLRTTYSSICPSVILADRTRDGLA